MKEDKRNTVFNGNNEDIRSEIKNILEECDKDLSENYIIDSDSEGYSEECRERFRKNEWKRVFSGDLYQKLYTIIFYQNFIKAREAMIHNSCAWQPCIKFFTLTEAQELCDLICPMEMREQINGNIQYNISEIHRPEDIWNIFNWFYTSEEFRYRFLHELRAFLTRRTREFASMICDSNDDNYPVLRKMEELKQIFDLTNIEIEIILFLYILLVDNYFCLGVFLDGLNGGDMKLEYIVEALGVNANSVLTALSSNSRLVRFGFVNTDELVLEYFFVNYLNGTQTAPVTDQFYSLFEGEALAWDMYGKFSEEEGTKLVQLIDSKPADQGLNILLHGASGTGKTSFVQSLAKKMGKQLYMIQLHSQDKEADTKTFRFAALEVANYRLDPEKVIVCVDECDDMLESGYCSDRAMVPFGEGSHRNSREKSLLNETMDRLKLTTIWVANTGKNSIDPSCRRRFDYNIVAP